MLRTAALEELSLDNVWLTIGSFDGVHRGHQSLLKRLVSEARRNQAVPAVLTFHPHPAVVLRGLSGPYYLTSPEERSRLIHALGVEEVILHPFDREVAGLSAREFVLKVCRHLGMRRLFVGPDFSLGRNREGNLSVLRQLGDEFGYTVEVIEPILNGDGLPISSSRIRRALEDGDVRLAAELLGRPYEVRGFVAPGDRRGRTIGIPTANLDIPIEQIAPKIGVYACLAEAAGRSLQAVTNIGVRPTFTDGERPPARIETHLLDFNDDLYGDIVALSFVERLRDEQRFANVQALIDQIQIDIRSAKQILT